MARPTKQGFDYFPLDVTFDDNMKLLIAECGHAGLSIIIQLWQKIYRNSYYIFWDEDTALLFSREINSEITEVNSVINVCFRRNLLCLSLYETYGVLTSRGVQKRYLEICNTSKRTNCTMESALYLCHEIDISDKIQVIEDITPVNSGITSVNTELSTQSKVNKRKEKESKEEHDIFFNSVWILIPSHPNDVKKKVSQARKQELFKIGYDKIKIACERYIETQPEKFRHKRDNFFNDVLDNYLDENYSKTTLKPKPKSSTPGYRDLADLLKD